MVRWRPEKFGKSSFYLARLGHDAPLAGAGHIQAARDFCKGSIVRADGSTPIPAVSTVSGMVVPRARGESGQISVFAACLQSGLRKPSRKSAKWTKVETYLREGVDA